jgi:chaperonin GroEL
MSLKDKFENLAAGYFSSLEALLIHSLTPSFRMSHNNQDDRRWYKIATVLIGAIYPEGFQNVAAGCNPMDLHQGSQAAVDHIIEFLAAHTKTITTTAEITHVATIFANGDKHIGNLIAQAMEKVGKVGVITVKKGRTIEDAIEITQGMRFDRGFISPYFVTDLKSQKAEFEKPFVFLSEKKISLLQDILPSLEAAAPARRPLVIVAEDVDEEALPEHPLPCYGGTFAIGSSLERIFRIFIVHNVSLFCSLLFQLLI